MDTYLQDRQAVADLMTGWIHRDLAEWDQLRAVFHADGVIEITWFEGDASDVVDGSTRMGASDIRTKYLVVAPVVTFHGDKAIAETPCVMDGKAVVDAVIVGGGTAGRVASAMLKRLGVDNQLMLDRARAGKEGPRVTVARTRTLRSPKELTGPAGLPALTFRAFYEARCGAAAWQALDRAPRTMWMDYLIRYRKVLNLPVRNNVSVEHIHARTDDLFAIDLREADGSRQILARHVVLVTGRDGLGGPYVPPVADRLDRRFWAHNADPIDFERLCSKRLAVIDVGASAMDNAAATLESGATRLDIFIRRPNIPRINKFTGLGSQGTVHGFARLPDDWKWRFLDYATKEQTPPPPAQRAACLRLSARTLSSREPDR
jgi:FAD-dependent urate hydroxylase